MTPTVIPAVFLAKDRMTSKIEQMQSKISRFAANTAEKFDKAGRTAFKVGRQSAMVGALVAAPLVVAAKTAVDFEEKMSNVGTLIDTNKESIQKMGDSVLAMATKLPVPIDELTTSLYDIRSAGIDASKQFETLESAAKLSVAGLSTVAEATNISTSALNAFRTEGLSAAKTNDILFKTVKYGKTTISQLSTGFGATAGTIQSAGVTLADFSAATAALTTVGTPATQAQTQLRAAIVALQKPTAEMDKIFKKLGVTSEKELIAREGGMVGAFDAINAAGVDMGLNLSKAWSSTEAVAAVNSVTGATKDTYLKAFEDMVNGPEALGEAFDKQGGTTKSQMMILKNNAQALSITVGQALLPVINDLVSAIMPYIQSAAEWVKRNKGLISTIVKVAAVVAGLAFAISGVSFAVGVAQKAMVLFGAAAKVALGPIGLIVAGIGLATAAYKAYTHFTKRAATGEELLSSVKERALENTIDQRVEIDLLFNRLKHAKAGTEAYKTALSQLDEIQPGIIEKYNLQTKSLDQLALAHDDVRKSLMARAMEEAKVELAKEKFKEAIERREGGAGTLDVLSGALSSPEAFLAMIQGDSQAMAKNAMGSVYMDANRIEDEGNRLIESVGPNEPADPNNTADGIKEVKLVINGTEIGTLGGLAGKQTEVKPFGGMMPSIPATR